MPRIASATKLSLPASPGKAGATPLLTIEEVAELIGVHSSTLRAWRRKGIGPAYIKGPRIVRYSMAAVQQWIEANTASQA
ncbi:MAG: helix-turn-helix domain-containing protein [Candidatus Competibacteraceae bacterium]